MNTAPVIVAIELEVPPERAFAAFTSEFGNWWPIASHSLSRDSAASCRFEARPGGVIDERSVDGSVQIWGEVLQFEPGRRVRFSWHPGRASETAQWVEVLFVTTPSGCRATLTHGGWRALGEIGPLLRDQYLPGWRRVFGELYAKYAQRPD